MAFNAFNFRLRGESKRQQTKNDIGIVSPVEVTSVTLTQNREDYENEILIERYCDYRITSAQHCYGK